VRPRPQCPAAPGLRRRPRAVRQQRERPVQEPSAASPGVTTSLACGPARVRILFFEENGMALHIEFPRTNNVVGGGGSLYAWGTSDQADIKAQVTWKDSGGTNRSQDPEDTSGTTLAHPQGMDWAFRFHGLPTTDDHPQQAPVLTVWN